LVQDVVGDVSKLTVAVLAGPAEQAERLVLSEPVPAHQDADGGADEPVAVDGLGQGACVVTMLAVGGPGGGAGGRLTARMMSGAKALLRVAYRLREAMGCSSATDRRQDRTPRTGVCLRAARANGRQRGSVARLVTCCMGSIR